MRFFKYGLLFLFFYQVGLTWGQENISNKLPSSEASRTIDSLEMILPLTSEIQQPALFVEIALLYRGIDDEKSAQYCRRAIKMKTKTPNHEAISDAYKMLSDMFYTVHQPDSALIYLQLAMEQANRQTINQQRYPDKSTANNQVVIWWLVLGLLLACLVFLVIFYLRTTSQNRSLRFNLLESEKMVVNTKELVSNFNLQVSEEVAMQTRTMTEKLSVAHQRELELKKKLKGFEESEYMKNTFLGSMSHDIRTPLNGIIGFSSILQTEMAVMGNAELYEYTKNIEESGIQLTSLLDNIIDISSIEANMLEVDWQLEYFGEIIKEVEEVYAAKAKDKGLVFKVKHDNDLPKLKADSIKLAKVFNLLVDNAVRYTEKGFVTISTTYNQPKNIAVIQIKDTGPGIDDGTLKALLASFQYGQQGKLQMYQGKGIGLTLAHRFVNLMGGKFSINSFPLQGTTITLTLPCDGEQPEPIDQIMDVGHATLTSAPELGHISIFIVEDDRMNRMVLEKILKNTGEIVLAEDGEEALFKIERAYKQGIIYQVMLFDMQLPPPWNGTSVMKAVKERFPEYKTVPFIVQTAFAMSGDKEQYLSEGFDDYISKPINKNELFIMIQKQLLLRNG